MYFLCENMEIWGIFFAKIKKWKTLKKFPKFQKYEIAKVL